MDNEKEKAEVAETTRQEETEKKISEGKLLYDPLFEKKPDTTLRDNPKKGFFGKAIVKKSAFILAIVFCVCASLILSFSSVTTEKYKYTKNDSGYTLHSFNGDEQDNVLVADGYDETYDITEIRRYAVCCNRYLEYIFIGKAVTKLEGASFYSCSELKAVIVHPDNQNYVSIDGVLYQKENGIPTKTLLYPQKNGYYRAALACGLTAPENEEQIAVFTSLYADNLTLIEEKYQTVGKSYEIADTVTCIGELTFTDCYEMEYIKIPDGVSTIETMAFFKCEKLNNLYLPDGLSFIGSDAFSSCKSLDYLFIPSSVKEIGHHAFNKCDGVKQVYVGAPDKKSIKLGMQWAPQQRKFFMVSVKVLYGQQRESR